MKRWNWKGIEVACGWCCTRGLERSSWIHWALKVLELIIYWDLSTRLLLSEISRRFVDTSHNRELALSSAKELTLPFSVAILPFFCTRFRMTAMWKSNWRLSAFVFLGSTFLASKSILRRIVILSRYMFRFDLYIILS